MKNDRLPRALTERELLNNMVSSNGRNFISEIDGAEYLCRYLGKQEKKALGYKIVPREKAIVLLYEYAGDEPFERAYALLEPRNDEHHKLIHLHNSAN